MAWNSDAGSLGWEEVAIDATAEAAFEAKAQALGLSGVVIVENVKLAVPSLAACLRRALCSALTASMGAHTRRPSTSSRGSETAAVAAVDAVNVRVRPGSAQVRNCPPNAAPFSFAVLPPKEDED